jgi:hypothetical protein
MNLVPSHRRIHPARSVLDCGSPLPLFPRQSFKLNHTRGHSIDPRHFGLRWQSPAERDGDTAFARTRVIISQKIFRPPESGGQPRAVQTLRAVCTPLGSRKASGVRSLQRRFRAHCSFFISQRILRSHKSGSRLATKTPAFISVNSRPDNGREIFRQ